MAPRASLLSVALVVASLVAGSTALEEVRSVGTFTGVAVASGIEVHAEVNTSAASPSLKLEGESSAVSGVSTYVDFWGTLLLSRSAGAASGHVVARVTVPTPLTFAGASTQGVIYADKVAGAVVASSYAKINVQELAPELASSMCPTFGCPWSGQTGRGSRSTSITSSSHSSIGVAEGHVSYISASASDVSSIDLGALTADSGSISVSSGSSLVGGTVHSATISVSSSSSLTMRATGSVGISCTQSTVHLSGGARVAQWANYQCNMNLARRLDATDVLV